MKIGPNFHQEWKALSFFAVRRIPTSEIAFSDNGKVEIQRAIYQLQKQKSSELSFELEIIQKMQLTGNYDFNQLKEIRKETLVIDLASKPYGIDRKIAEQEKLNFIEALGLPRKISTNNISKVYERHHKTIYMKNKDKQ